jgi:hypothetical protein
MHPKTEIRPVREAVERVLERGWAGQLKVHGHRAQIHLPSEAGVAAVAYNRQGGVHQRRLPPSLVDELRRLFQPRTGWTVIDAEWLKATDELFVFDVIKREGQLLSALTYEERWNSLPRIPQSPVVHILPLLRTIDKCMEALADPRPMVEGIVLKALGTPGFSDTAIIRCRIPGRA